MNRETHSPPTPANASRPRTSWLSSTHSAGAASRAADPETIRPFRVRTPDTELVDLRRRIVATRWPDRETVEDQSQGVALDKLL